MCADQKKKREKERDKGKNKGKKQVNVMNYSVAGLHSKGQCSLTFVTGSEREGRSRWNK